MCNSKLKLTRLLKESGVRIQSEDTEHVKIDFSDLSTLFFVSQTLSIQLDPSLHRQALH